MEKEVLAVLGIARQGPIARYRIIIYTKENPGCTLDARCSSPPDFVTAITPRIGSPTALTANPRNALQVCVPAWAPRKGGNIRFPAPKNMENRVTPISTLFFKLNFSIFSPFFAGPHLRPADSCIILYRILCFFETFSWIFL